MATTTKAKSGARILIGLALVLAAGAAAYVALRGSALGGRSDGGRRLLAYVAERQQSVFVPLERYGRDAMELAIQYPGGTAYTLYLGESGLAVPGNTTEPIRRQARIVTPPGEGPTKWPTLADTKCPVTKTRADAGVLAFGGSQVPEPTYLHAAAANLDQDEALDCWSVASTDRKAADGTVIKAGVPFHEQDDAAVE